MHIVVWKTVNFIKLPNAAKSISYKTYEQVFIKYILHKNHLTDGSYNYISYVKIYSDDHNHLYNFNITQTKVFI